MSKNLKDLFSDSWVVKISPNESGEPTNDATYQEEFGTVEQCDFCDAIMHDSAGKVVEIPICEKCGQYKIPMIGIKFEQWFCGSMECNNNQRGLDEKQ